MTPDGPRDIVIDHDELDRVKDKIAKS